MSRSIVTADALENRLVFFDNTLNHVIDAPGDDTSQFYQISEMLQTNVSARYAFATFRLVLIERNREKIINLLQLLEFLVKVSTNEFRRYVGNADFLDELHSLTQCMPADVVKAIINFVNFCKHALVNFGSEMKHLEDFYKILKAEGHSFPNTRPNDMFVIPKVDILVPPKWIDGDFCENCHVKFSTFNRKHHCRSCGNIFCKTCSSKTANLPDDMLSQSSRVCDHCYTKLTVSTLSNIVQTDIPPRINDVYSTFVNSPVAAVAATTEDSRREEEDFERAIQLSLKEYNEKEAAKLSQSMKPVVNTPIFAEDLYVQKQDQRKYDLPVFSSTVSNDEYIDEAFMKGCEETARLVEDRLLEAKTKGTVLYRDVNLQAYIQTLIAKQGQLQSLIQSNSSEQSRVADMLGKIDHVSTARKSFDDVQRQYKLNVKRQQEESEMLLRLQTEQKMEFMRKQRQENEEQRKILDELHRRNIQTHTPNVTLSDYNQNYEKQKNENLQSMNRDKVYPSFDYREQKAANIAKNYSTEYVEQEISRQPVQFVDQRYTAQAMTGYTSQQEAFPGQQYLQPEHTGQFVSQQAHPAQHSLHQQVNYPGQHVTQPSSYPGQHVTHTSGYPNQHVTQLSEYPGQHVTQSPGYPGHHVTQLAGYPGQHVTHPSSYSGPQPLQAGYASTLYPEKDARLPGSYENYPMQGATFKGQPVVQNFHEISGQFSETGGYFGPYDYAGEQMGHYHHNVPGSHTDQYAEQIASSYQQVRGYPGHDLAHIQKPADLPKDSGVQAPEGSQNQSENKGYRRKGDSDAKLIDFE